MKFVLQYNRCQHILLILWTLVLTGSLFSCGPVQTNIIAHPKGYDLTKPRVLHLPVVLNEISGLAYYAKDSSLFAIQDEEGYLYKIFPYRPDSMMRWKFAGHGDFEDLLLFGQAVYVLRSDGDLFYCTINDSVSTTKYEFPEKGNEFESLYYDSANRVIRIVCKDCEADKRKSLSTFAFDPETRQYKKDSLKFDAKEIARIGGEEKIKFKPSAAAVNPKNGKLYIVSAVNKLLVIANLDGTIDNAYDLDPAYFKQPEGIAFAPNGTMFIANEFAGVGTATLLIFPYQPGFK